MDNLVRAVLLRRQLEKEENEKNNEWKLAKIKKEQGKSDRKRRSITDKIDDGVGNSGVDGLINEEVDKDEIQGLEKVSFGVVVSGYVSCLDEKSYHHAMQTSVGLLATHSA